MFEALIIEKVPKPRGKLARTKSVKLKIQTVQQEQHHHGGQVPELTTEVILWGLESMRAKPQYFRATQRTASQILLSSTHLGIELHETCSPGFKVPNKFLPGGVHAAAGLGATLQSAGI